MTSLNSGRYIIWKKWGETPLEALERLRVHLGLAKEIPMTYAGRLDPAVEGLLIILVGDECKKKDEYTKLRKTYSAEILIGVATDSYDLLGLPSLMRRFSRRISRFAYVARSRTVDWRATKKGVVLNSEFQITPPQSSPQQGEEENSVNISDVDKFFKSQLGVHTQSYPPYSSKTVDGVQLHAHARSGTEVEMPTHEVELYENTSSVIGERTKEEILNRVQELTKVVTGDFRQAEITQAWRSFALPKKLQTVSFSLSVSSGFYIRQCAEDLGRALGTGACLYSLVRTQIGEYTKKDCEI